MPMFTECDSRMAHRETSYTQMIHMAVEEMGWQLPMAENTDWTRCVIHLFDPVSGLERRHHAVQVSLAVKVREEEMDVAPERRVGWADREGNTHFGYAFPRPIPAEVSGWVLRIKGSSHAPLLLHLVLHGSLRGADASLSSSVTRQEWCDTSYGPDDLLYRAKQEKGLHLAWVHEDKDDNDDKDDNGNGATDTLWIQRETPI